MNDWGSQQKNESSIRPGVARFLGQKWFYTLQQVLGSVKMVTAPRVKKMVPKVGFFKFRSSAFHLNKNSQPYGVRWAEFLQVDVLRGVLKAIQDGLKSKTFSGIRDVSFDSELLNVHPRLQASTICKP